MLNTSSAFHFHANKCLTLKKIVDHQQKLVHPNSKCQKVRWGILQLISKRRILQKLCLSAFYYLFQRLLYTHFVYLVTREVLLGKRLPKTYKSKIYILLFMRISIPLKNVNFISMLMRIHAETVKCHPVCNGERLHVFAEFIIVEQKKRKCFFEMLVVYCQCCWSRNVHFILAHGIH